jgi:hypothetical protein
MKKIIYLDQISRIGNIRFMPKLNPTTGNVRVIANRQQVSVFVDDGDLDYITDGKIIITNAGLVKNNTAIEVLVSKYEDLLGKKSGVLRNAISEMTEITEEI